MAHILPDTRMATPASCCPHGTVYAQPCYSCGWTCPACGRCYAPWVRECNYKHENPRGSTFGSGELGPFPLNIAPAAPDRISVTQMHFRFSPEWSTPGYQQISKIGRSWREILPGLQCYVQNPVPNEDGDVTLHLRLTPEGGTDEPSDA